MATSPITPTETARLVDNWLDSYFSSSIQQATLIDPLYADLWEHMRHFITTGGKRIRPYMVMLAYQAFDGDDIEMIIPVAAAHEILHTSLLIHDDIIDRDFIRRGVPNVIGRYQESYARYDMAAHDQLHYAQSSALLGGDVLISEAYNIIIESDLPDSDKMRAQKILREAIFEVAGGELIDTEMAFRHDTHVDPDIVTRYKTSGYSFISPLVTGATLARASADQIASLRLFATHLGLAFQLTDDILGVFGSSEETGKPNDSDIKEGKRSYLALRCIDMLAEHERTKFLQVFGNPSAGEAEINLVRDLMKTSGALQDTEHKIESNRQKSLELLSSLGVTPEYQSALESLVVTATARKS